MVNILFENTGKQTLVLSIDKNDITWPILFNFIEKKIGVSENKIKLSIFGKTFFKKSCGKFPKSFHWENFMKKTDDFIIFKIKYFQNIDWQVSHYQRVYGFNNGKN